MEGYIIVGLIWTVLIIGLVLGTLIGRFRAQKEEPTKTLDLVNDLSWAWSMVDQAVYLLDMDAR